MDLTREYFSKIGFIKSVEKLKEFQTLDPVIIETAENLKPRISELKNRFQNYRNLKKPEDYNKITKQEYVKRFTDYFSKRTNFSNATCVCSAEAAFLDWDKYDRIVSPEESAQDELNCLNG